MVEVATGGGSGVSGGTGGNSGGSSSGGDEQLPMVIRVPHLGYDPLSVCWQRYSLLGFGDILVPGMLVGFCHGFDLATANRRKLYYISTLIGKCLMNNTREAALILGLASGLKTNPIFSEN